jgi:hypothetical protein
VASTTGWFPTRRSVHTYIIVEKSGVLAYSGVRARFPGTIIAIIIKRVSL